MENLIENVDYYTEDGNVIFTREYHLKRGKCCSSGCRHCPWNEKIKKDPFTPFELQNQEDEESEIIIYDGDIDS